MPLALMGQALILTASIYPEGKLFSRMNERVSCAVELSQATFSKTVFLLAKQSPFLLERRDVEQKGGGEQKEAPSQVLQYQQHDRLLKNLFGARIIQRAREKAEEEWAIGRNASCPRGIS